MMKRYDPQKAPDPEAWLSLDEATRINLIMDYHSDAGKDIPGDHLHAVVHTVIENQIAPGDDYPVKSTIERLMDEGLDRHDAIHAVGSVLIKHLWKVGKKEVTEGFSDDYFEEVRQLTAQQWLEEFGAKDF